MKYVKGFDTLRALAVLLVIISHWGPEFSNKTMVGFVKQTFVLEGPFGVYLFFVLSGFLITSILLHEKNKNPDVNKFIIIKNFFIRRSLRIFPIYYLFIAFCFLCNYKTVVHYVWCFLTYTSNFIPYTTNQTNEVAHTWSLAVEEQFYLVWPWLIIFVRNKYLKYIMMVSIAVGLLSRYYVLYVGHHLYPFLSINCIDSFAIGGLYAYARLNAETTRRFEKAFRILCPLFIFFVWRMSPFSGLPMVLIYTKFINDIIALALIMFAINNDYAWIQKYIMENRVLNFIGKISYGLYLYHFTLGPVYGSFITKYVKNHPGTPAILTNYYCMYAVKLALLFILCWLSYNIIEKPLLRLKKKFDYVPAGAK